MEVDPSPQHTADSSEQDCDFEEVEVEQVEVRRSGRVSVPADHFNQSQHAAWTDYDLNKPHVRVRALGESYDERGDARDTACAEACLWLKISCGLSRRRWSADAPQWYGCRAAASRRYRQCY